MPHDHSAFAPHDHAACAGDTMARAEERLAASGQRLTPVRRRTLQILLESHRALGAYEVLERLVADGYGNQPPVAYRALEFLEDQGLVHRIRRLNAFTACMHPGELHAPAFLICRDCHAVAEAPAAAVGHALEAAARALHFTVERATIEALGLCPACQPMAAKPGPAGDTPAPTTRGYA
jgi:Fur family transcriptional regulator, zinc uptake regulator